MSLVSNLRDLPNEILIIIFSYLDPLSFLNFRQAFRRIPSCSWDIDNQRFLSLTSDQYSLVIGASWRAISSKQDTLNLKLILRRSKVFLNHFSLISYNGQFCLGECFKQILQCHNLQSISVNEVVTTEVQVFKLLQLSCLTCLHLGRANAGLYGQKVMEQPGPQLKALSLDLDSYDRPITSYIDKWCSGRCKPPELRIASHNCVDRLDVDHIMKLSPSRTGSVYLSLFCLNSIVPDPTQPYLQFWFTTDLTPPILNQTSIPCIGDFSLTADPPGSNNFSTATAKKDVVTNNNIEFKDVSNKLTMLRLPEHLTSQCLQCLAEECPKIVHLDVCGCTKVLDNLDGLDAVRKNCPNLRVLNLFGIPRANSVARLWTILAKMDMLRVLFIPYSLMGSGQITSMPCLRTINIDGSFRSSEVTTENILDLLARIHSLAVFKFKYVPVSASLLNLLPAYNLTRLYISMISGKNLTLPTDSSYYVKLEEMFLDCEDFEFTKDMALALANPKKLCVLVLNVASFDRSGIDLLYEFLSVFYIHCFQLRTQKKSILNGLKQKNRGKRIDFKIMEYIPSESTFEQMFNRFPEHVY